MAMNGKAENKGILSCTSLEISKMATGLTPRNQEWRNSWCGDRGTQYPCRRSNLHPQERTDGDNDDTRCHRWFSHVGKFKVHRGQVIVTQISVNETKLVLLTPVLLPTGLSTSGNISAPTLPVLITGILCQPATGLRASRLFHLSSHFSSLHRPHHHPALKCCRLHRDALLTVPWGPSDPSFTQ